MGTLDVETLSIEVVSLEKVEVCQSAACVGMASDSPYHLLLRQL